MLSPTLEQFLAQTDSPTPGEARRMAVTRDILADLETPLSAYWKLAHDEPHSFLLESVTGGEQVSRFSILGVRPKSVIRVRGSQVTRHRGDSEERFSLGDGQDPLHVLEQELGTDLPVETPGLPRFSGGAVGMISYDIVRFFEKLPTLAKDDLELDTLAMMLADTVVVFDHAKNLLRIVCMAEGTADGYAKAEQEIQRVEARLRSPLPDLPTGSYPVHPVQSNVTQEEYEAMVSRMIAYITQGDGIQMVPSQRFSTEVQAHPLTIYRSLRSLNPSPYMFLLRFGDFDLVGASPELLVSLDQGTARVRPIAGTRWRGKSLEEDAELERELLADEKERAEHIMLVDLGRNDLGRVCEYGSVQVNELMVVERYSHVMHIVSDVTGRLATGKTSFDLFRATHPAGTVSGAPKVRAMEIIEELEPTRRGTYAGAVGMFSHNGNLDTCITIRTILLKHGMAYVQAGAGVVYDSVPNKEYVETLNKAKASLTAIELAQRGL